MDTEPLLTAIAAALKENATSEARATGASACRSILTALETPSSPTTPSVAALVSALRHAPREQLFDFAIAKLRSALPAGVDAPAVAPIKFHLVPIPPRG
jgi:hypothetical protein